MRVMKHATGFLTVIALVTTVAPTAAQTLEKLAQNNRITVSFRESSVPFSYVIGSTKAVGFSVDLTNAIVDDLRKKVNRPHLDVIYMPVTAQNRIPLLVSGAYDLECGSTTNTSSRGKDVAFSVSYFYAGTRLLVKKSSGIQNYGDLMRKTVASIGGSTNEKVLRAYGSEKNLDLQLVLGKDYDEGLQLLETDQAAALALDDILLFGLKANSKNSTTLEVVGETLQVEPYGCMMRKDDPEFKKVVDRTITRLMNSGEFTKLYAKWFESPIPPKGVNLSMPMSSKLKENLKLHSDKPAQ